MNNKVLQTMSKLIVDSTVVLASCGLIGLVVIANLSNQANAWLFEMLYQSSIIHDFNVPKYVSFQIGTSIGLFVLLLGLVLRRSEMMKKNNDESDKVLIFGVFTLCFAFVVPVIFAFASVGFAATKGNPMIAGATVEKDAIAIMEVAPQSEVAHRLIASLKSPEAYRNAKPWLIEFYKQPGLEMGLPAIERAAKAAPARDIPSVADRLATIDQNGVMTRADRIDIAKAIIAAPADQISAIKAEGLLSAMVGEHDNSNL